MSEYIATNHEANVTTVTIDRPGKKNAITQAMYGALADAIRAYESNDDIGALIMTAAGDSFTAGNDLNDFSTDVDGTPGVTRFLHAIRDCKKPIIAAVNGQAIGIGLTMLLHCDLVYAAERATFSAPFVKLGLVPEGGSSMLLPASVGMAVANDILLAGRVLTADEAHRYGLVARVFPDAELGPAVRAIATNVAALAPAAVRYSKSLIRCQRDRVAAQMRAEGRLFAQQLQSEDFATRVAAIMNRRSAAVRD